MFKGGYRFLILFIIAFFSFETTVHTQNLQKIQEDKVRALEKQLKEKNSDTTEVNLLAELARNLVTIDKLNEAMQSANQAILIAEKAKYKKGLATAYASLGVVEAALGHTDKSILTFQKSLKLCQELNFRKEEGFVYSHLAQAYWNKLDTNMAMDLHFKALEINRELKIPNRQAFACDFIGHLYAQKGNYKEALKYYTESARLFTEIGENHRIALSYGNMGLMNAWMNNKDAALKNYFKAIDYYDIENNTKGVIWNYGLIADLYTKINDFENALTYVDKALALNNKLNNLKGIAENYSHLGLIYSKMELFENANDNFKKSLNLYKELDDKYGQMKCLFYMGECKFSENELNEALTYLDESLALAIQENKRRVISDCKRVLGAIFVKLGNASVGKSYLNDALKIDVESSNTISFPFIYKYLAKGDSLMGDYKSALLNYQMFYKYAHSEKLDVENAELTAVKYEFSKKEELVKAELKMKRFQRNLAAIGAIIMVVLTIIAIYIYELRKKKLKSEQKIIELERRELELVKESERFKTKFLTNISHEFRTPLTLINGHIEILKGKIDGKYTNSLLEMEKNGKLLLQLINQLMDLSKLEFGDYQLRFRQGNALKETISLFQSFHSYAEQLGIKLVIQPSNSAKEYFSTSSMGYSSEALMLIINNFMSNALKFTPKGGNIKAVIDWTEDAELKIEVMDTGIGIPEDKIDKVFDRFYKVENELQQQYSGSGVGLALVKELAILHGGAVSVRPNPVGGSIFEVRLKNSVETSTQEDLNSAELFFVSEIDIQDEINKDATEGPLILVVEDQSDLRRFIVENLGSQYRFIEANNGRVGLELAKEHIPDLIISDIMMPNIDGIDMCVQLKNNELTSHIPFVFLTAKAETDDILEGLKSGADEYIIKPFSIEELKWRVRNILRTKSLQRAKLKNHIHSVTPHVELVDELNSRDKAFLNRIEEFVNENINNTQFGVKDLAEMCFISVSQLTRKMKSLTGATPAEFIKTMRLNKAVELLLKNEAVSDVAWSVGFEDPVYFSKTFKKHFGFPPSEAKNVLKSK